MKITSVFTLLLLIAVFIAIETTADISISIDETVRSMPDAFAEKTPEEKEENAPQIPRIPDLKEETRSAPIDAKESLNHRSDAYNPNSKRYNPSTKQKSGGRTSRTSAKIAAGLQADQNAPPKPLGQSLPEMQSSLNHRSDAFNPNSKRFNQLRKIDKEERHPE
jgi:hypothetical protein